MANIDNSIVNVFLSVENTNSLSGGSTNSTSGASLPLNYTTTTVGDNVIAIQSAGDLNSRLIFTSRPEIQWGGGSGNPDTFLYRGAAGQLTLSTTSLGTANGTLALGTMNAAVYQLNGVVVVSFPGTNNGFIGTFVTPAVTGVDNLGVGPQAMASIGSGNDNVGVGYSAGKAISTGSNNTLYGSTAGLAISSGSGNTFIGAAIAPAVTNGNNNVGVGYNCVFSNGISNSIAIGANTSVTASNTTVIGNTSTTACTIYGTISFTQGTLGNNVMTLQSTAGVGSNPSEQVYQNKVTTTDATVTTLHTFAIPASNIVTLDVIVTARRTGGLAGTAEDGGTFKLFAAYKNPLSTAAIVGGTGAVPQKTALADQAWDVNLTPSAGNVLVQVTGAVNNNVSWVMTARYYAVNT